MFNNQRQQWQQPHYTPPWKGPDAPMNQGPVGKSKLKGIAKTFLSSGLASGAGEGAATVGPPPSGGDLEGLLGGGAIDGISGTPYRGPDVGGGGPQYGQQSQGLLNSFTQGFNNGGLDGGFQGVGQDLVKQGGQYWNQLSNFFR
tara:strand:+ start:199 stop:630 length:432 start_codon:yes stop_codon:yes gene_type:complete